MNGDQIQQYVQLNRQWQKSDIEHLQGWQDLQNRSRFHVHLINQLGHWMIEFGQYLERTTEVSRQTAIHAN